MSIVAVICCCCCRMTHQMTVHFLSFESPIRCKCVVLIVQNRLVRRRVGRVPPLPTTTLQSCDDNFYFLNKQSVHLKSWLSLNASCRSRARGRRPFARTFATVISINKIMFPPLKEKMVQYSE